MDSQQGGVDSVFRLQFGSLSRTETVINLALGIIRMSAQVILEMHFYKGHV